MTAAYPPAFVPPAHLWVPPGRRGTYGDEVVDFAAAIGHSVDAEQAAALDALASFGPGGLWHTLEVGIVEGRQNGKTDRTILPLTMYDFWVRRVEHIVWTAHQMDTARDVFDTVQRLVEANEMLSRRVAEIRESKTEEAVILKSGATLEFRTRSKMAGRGKHPYDEWIVDEALFVTGPQMGARLPTLSSRPNPHVRYASSPSLAESDHLRRLKRRGRSGTDPSLIWVEYCAPGSFREPGCADGPDCTHAYGAEGCTLDREELWHLANHSLGRRISYAFVRNERATLDPVEFARERLGWHEDGPEDEAQHPLDAAAFKALSVDVSPAEQQAPAFFVTVGVNGATVIAAAVARRPLDPFTAAAAVLQPGPTHLPDTRDHVELADRRPGSDWLAERLAELAERWPGARFAGSKNGPIAGLVEAGLPVEVELLPPAERAQACRHHEKLTAGRRYTWRADPSVLLSFSGAVSKPVGDGLWAWDWRASKNLAEIDAQGGALWLLEKYRGVAYDPLDSVV